MSNTHNPIVYELRRKISQSFTLPDEGTEAAREKLARGFFQFTANARLDCWVPDLLGASKVPPGTIRVTYSGPEHLWISDGEEFTRRES